MMEFPTAAPTPLNRGAGRSVAAFHWFLATLHQTDFDATVCKRPQRGNKRSGCVARMTNGQQHRLQVGRREIETGLCLQQPVSHDALVMLSVNDEFDVPPGV